MKQQDIQAVEQLKEARARIRKELSKVIIGQDQVVDETLISIFTRSHSLLLGVPTLLAAGGYEVASALEDNPSAVQAEWGMLLLGTAVSAATARSTMAFQLPGSSAANVTTWIESSGRISVIAGTSATPRGGVGAGIRRARPG